GYSSPKYISFMNLMKSNFKNIEIETYERWDYPRSKYNIPNFHFKRNILSGWLEKIKPDENKFWIRLLRKFSLVISEILMILKIIQEAKDQNILLVTTFENPLFGLIKSRNVCILQNYSEIWGEDHLNLSGKIQALLFSSLLDKYRGNVKLCVSPQHDRLLIAEKTYPNAKQYLVLNCPPIDTSETRNKDFNEIKILYQGVIGNTNYPLQLINTLAELSNHYEVHFAGKVDDNFKEFFNKSVKESSIIEHGYLNQFQLSELRLKCNVGIVYWDDSNLNTKFCAPNKLFEYISSGYFVISSVNHSLNDFYNRFQYGVNIDAEKVDVVNVLSNIDIETMNRVSKRNVGLFTESLNFESQNEKLISDLSKFINSESH
ncbi:hypothetical protein, partial [Photobacterium profundum]|uniref:hypothetical protein n=1 Tax=Photobacterium profundum TaxID=74109 RepID=UPI003D0D807D